MRSGFQLHRLGLESRATDKDLGGCKLLYSSELVWVAQDSFWRPSFFWNEEPASELLPVVGAVSAEELRVIVLYIP